LKAPEVAAAVLRAKVRGTLVLEEVFRDRPVDFLVLCSSLTAVLGGFGQVDYCGANAFLDAYAHSRPSFARVTLALNWDTWSDVGMAVETELPPELEADRREVLKRGLSAREGAEVFRRLLGCGLPQVLVSATDLGVRVQRAARSGTAQESAAPARRTRHPRPQLRHEYVAPATELEIQVAGIWAELLGFEQVGIHDDFTDLGGHSLLLVQVRTRLCQALEQDVSLVELFRHPTVARLASFLGAGNQAQPSFDRIHQRARQRSDALRKRRQSGGPNQAQPRPGQA
jgi:hypothetical protein